jgi:hypothetical protein
MNTVLDAYTVETVARLRDAEAFCGSPNLIAAAQSTRTEEQARADIAADEQWAFDCRMACRLEQIGREWLKASQTASAPEYAGVCVDRAMLYDRAASAVRGRLCEQADAEAREVRREQERNGEYVHRHCINE